jgi:hypothetical protein
MENLYQVIVPLLGTVHEGNDVVKASAVFYAHMTKSQVVPHGPSVLLFEQGMLVSMFQGNDFKEC